MMLMLMVRMKTTIMMMTKRMIMMMMMMMTKRMIMMMKKGKLAPELIWALRQQALWGREQEADKTTPGQKENTSWPLLLGVMVLLMIVMRRSTMIDGHGKPLRSNRNHQTVTKRIKQAERKQRPVFSFSSSSSYLMRVTMLMMGYCDEGGSLGST